MAKWNLFDGVSSVILKFPAVLKFPADDLQFPAVVFSFEENSNVNFIITIIVTYYLLIIIIIIIIKSHNNYCSAGVMELFVEFVDIDWLFFV